MAKSIKHLIVLMLENRSFDHAVGFMKSNAYPIDGLNGNETNPDTQGTSVRVSSNARYVGDLKDDPGHDFISVNEQIFGNSQGAGNGPFMQGFVKSYQAKTGNLANSHRIMKCFSPRMLPALTALAREYALCERWFCSVPGPTLPNRAFAFGATSLGRVNMSPNYLTLKTIFERLTAHGVTSKIYYVDWTFGLAVKHISIDNPSRYLRFYDDFRDDCAKNRLPAYSFLEPRFYDRSQPGPDYKASDQHPDHNVANGERLIREVYDSITRNQQTWENSLLVITYDEHGGLFDHVRPPSAVSPDGIDSATPPFKFDRLGVRVPAVIVSPYIPAGTIIKDVFDHTSIIATARKLFLSGIPNTWLTERDRRANTFEGCLTLNQPRQGKVAISTPSTTQPLGLARSGKIPQNKKLSELQEAALVQMLSVETALPRSKQNRIIVPKTEHEAAEYFAEIQKRIAGKSKRGRRPAPSVTRKRQRSVPRKDPGK
ncbi:MAG TPA: alkaline phosphatase family protein [Pyrinomonadaceae bacterium]|nr:alkaline phosphatase family protein [Pyrinomonadaceae bacterium]